MLAALASALAMAGAAPGEQRASMSACACTVSKLCRRKAIEEKGSVPHVSATLRVSEPAVRGRVLCAVPTLQCCLA